MRSDFLCAAVMVTLMVASGYTAQAVETVYAAQGPDLGIKLPGTIDMAPKWLGDTAREIEAIGGFGPVEMRSYSWEDTTTTARYVALLGAYSDDRILPPEVRSRLFEQIADVIDAAGGSVTMPTVSRLLMARRT